VLGVRHDAISLLATYGETHPLLHVHATSNSPNSRTRRSISFQKTPPPIFVRNKTCKGHLTAHASLPAGLNTDGALPTSPETATSAILEGSYPGHPPFPRDCPGPDAMGLAPPPDPHVHPQPRPLPPCLPSSRSRVAAVVAPCRFLSGLTALTSEPQLPKSALQRLS
jgi:hypothetical protein